MVLMAVLALSGCANIPQEAVTLNKEVSAGITSIHESNVRFINQYFDMKKAGVDRYEKQALDSFFNAVATATAKPGAPPLAVKDLYNIKSKIEEIHAMANQYKDALEKSKALIIEKVQGEYNLLISANSDITGLLQAAVDVDKAKNDGLVKVKTYTDGKIDLTDIDAEIDDYLAKLGSSSAKASKLIESIEKVLDSRKGDK